MPIPTPDSSSDRFTGFPAGAKNVAVPATLLSRVVPGMTDVAELAVTLYAISALQQLRRFPRLLDVAALRAQRPLVDALAGLVPDTEVEIAFTRGLDAAARRRTLLLVEAEGPDGPRRLLALNTPADRRTLERLQRGELSAGPALTIRPAAPRHERNIYGIYERTVAPITPQIADELAEAEALYPWDWIEDAFREAEQLNKRSWRYVRRILERWHVEGRDDAAFGRHPGKRSDSRYEHLIRH